MTKIELLWALFGVFFGVVLGAVSVYETPVVCPDFVVPKCECSEAAIRGCELNMSSIHKTLEDTEMRLTDCSYEFERMRSVASLCLDILRIDDADGGPAGGDER